VLALTTQRPSGDRDSADHMIAESRQPNAETQMLARMSGIALRMLKMREVRAFMISRTIVI